MSANPQTLNLNHLHLWMIGSSAASSAALAALIWARWCLAELTQAQAVKISDAIWMLISIHSFVLILVATLLHSRRS